MLFLDKFLQGLKPQFDDDVVDRLNYYYTPMLLVIFALTLSAKQYVGQPIQCWIPAQFTGAWEQYSENYCFVQNTYFLPLTHYIPNDIQEREEREIGYYQWVPFVLGLQGILFYLPSLIWRILNWQSGVAVKGIVQMCEDVGNMNIEKRKSSVEVVATHLRDSLRTQQQLLKRNIFGTLLRRGSFLNVLYILVKFIYLAQVLIQFVILNRFLGTSYTLWGFDILRDLAYGREWHESGHFPRVTMCDFEVRVLGNKHRHTVQCVLMINMFNEKIFVFLWFWYCILAITSVWSFLTWLVTSLNERSQINMIAKYLEKIDPHTARSITRKSQIREFVQRTLRPDGLFLIQLISKNSGDLITCELLTSLWKEYLATERRPPPYDEPPLLSKKPLD